MLSIAILLVALVPISQALRTGIMCPPGNGYLHCPKDYAIIVHNITIGCTDTYICESWDAPLEAIPGESRELSTAASPGFSGLRISEVCNNRRECIITSLHNERCRGRYKYIAVIYNCIKPQCVNAHGNDADCDNWAKGAWAKANGTECVNNAYWMAQNCYKSCTECNAECMNVNRDDWQCDYWAQVNECEYNRNWMAAQCERSCKTCSPARVGCVNLHGNDKECEDWAKRGDCASRPNWMTRFCRKACNQCHKECRDVAGVAKCAERAAAGECDTNKKVMWASCTKSCGKCPKNEDECRNVETDAKCAEMAKKGECWTDPERMQGSCKKACLCHTGLECFNLYRDDYQCDSWTRSGECKTNPGWMINNCRRSCGFCV